MDWTGRDDDTLGTSSLGCITNCIAQLCAAVKGPTVDKSNRRRGLAAAAARSINGDVTYCAVLRYGYTMHRRRVHKTNFQSTATAVSRCLVRKRKARLGSSGCEVIAFLTVCNCRNMNMKFLIMPSAPSCLKDDPMTAASSFPRYVAGVKRHGTTEGAAVLVCWLLLLSTTTTTTNGRHPRTGARHRPALAAAAAPTRVRHPGEERLSHVVDCGA